MSNIEEAFNNILRLLMDISKEKNQQKIDECLQLFFENLKIIKDDVTQTKKEQDGEIESHKEHIKYLNSLPKNPKINELIQKENDLIDIIKKESNWLDKTYLILSIYEDLNDILSSSEKKNKLQYEINIIDEDLRK